MQNSVDVRPADARPGVPRRLVLTLDEAAFQLSISRRTLCKLIGAGKVRTVKVSDKRKGVPLAEVQRIATEGV